MEYYQEKKETVGNDKEFDFPRKYKNSKYVCTQQ